MEKMNDLSALLKHEIQDLYSVEEQILEALPKMISKANNKTLKDNLSAHLKITGEHKKRLDKIQKELNEGNEESNEKKGFLSGLFGGGKQVCKGMQGIIEESNKMLGENMSPAVLDAAIIACAQKVEHYEICGYGTARTYARELGLEPIARLLEQTLNEEYQADDLLTQLAESRVNVKAGGATREGSARSRSGKPGGRERIEKTERTMEPVSAAKTNGSRKTASSSSKAGSPKPGASPRAANGRTETASSKKTAGNERHTAKKSASSNARSNGRTGSTRSHSGR